MEYTYIVYDKYYYEGKILNIYIYIGYTMDSGGGGDGGGGRV